MDYKLHYARLIVRARKRTLGGYSERHHIKPRCMGGSDHARNLVRLTPEEHYVAHQLLVKMYPGNFKLLCAVTMMTGKSKYRRNKLYGWLRRQFSEAQQGKFVSEETRAKQSLSHKGKPLSEAQIKGNASRRGRPVSQAARDALTQARHDPEVWKKRGPTISAAKKGNPQSEAHKAALSAVRKGRVLSEEDKAKKSAALKGRPKSEETRLKMSLAAKKREVDRLASMTPEVYAERMRAIGKGRKVKTIDT